MEKLRTEIQNSYEVYKSNFIKGNKVEDLFKNRVGYDIAVIKAFKEYFDNMLNSDYDVIAKIVSSANKVGINLFCYILEVYWNSEIAINFMLYEECKKLLESVR